jgi:N-methylhydantoinase B
MPHRDGTNGSGADAAYLKNTPIEITETEVPIEFVKYGLTRDSGGPGRWRGGLATEMAFRVFAPDSRITVRNRDRSFFRAWGILGGMAGGLSEMSVNPGTAEERHLGNIDTAVLQPGDVLQIRSAGGGGRGDPTQREAWRVLQDVVRNYVSVEAAERDYGVVVRDGKVDETRTKELRESRPKPIAHFHFGPERTAYEQKWTPAAYKRLHDLLAALPIHWRFFTKTEIFRRLGDRAGPDGVQAAFDEVCKRFSSLPYGTAARWEAAE